MSAQHTPIEALELLVRDLNATNWSSWQSTATFGPALQVAEQVVQRERIRLAAPDLYAIANRLGKLADGLANSNSSAEDAAADLADDARALVRKINGEAA